MCVRLLLFQVNYLNDLAEIWNERSLDSELTQAICIPEKSIVPAGLAIEPISHGRRRRYKLATK